MASRPFLIDRRALVIGGASGFGRAVAASLVDAGASVIVTSRDIGRADTAAAALSNGAVPVEARRLDVADTAGLAAFFAALDPVDHVISTAGGFMGGGFVDAPFETIRRAVEEKFFAALRTARAAAPKIRDGGSLTFTAGSGGKPQNASGAIVGNDSVRTLVRGLAVELAPRLRVNAVSPTWTRTPLWDFMSPEALAETERDFAAKIPLARTATIDEVASAYMFLVGNGFVTGQSIAVDGGIELV